MPSSEGLARAIAAAFLVTTASTTTAAAQQPANGFAVERFYPSAPGAGWFVMDALDMHGSLGAVAALTAGYARAPLRVATSDGAQRLTVVSDQAFADFGFAATYEWMRLYVNFNVPLLVSGDSGSVGAYSFAAPKVELGSHPDTMSDARIGFDARFLGTATSAFRLGAGVQLLVPNGSRADYDTDGSYRTMARILFAGELGHFVYAGHLGVHVRPLDDSPAPGSPRGSEFLFGAAGGARLLPLRRSCALVIGPEFYGASAWNALFGGTSTALEGLVSARVEGTGNDGAQLRIRLGTGAGLNSRFGAPDWRVVVGIELFNHHGAP